MSYGFAKYPLVALAVMLAGCGDDDAGDVPDAAPPTIDAAPPAVDGAPPDAAPPACAPTALDPALPWYGQNREQLQSLLDTRGCATAGYDPAKPPVALFDWDNTVIKNDVGDAVTFWMIANGKIRQPPGQDWANTSPFLTVEARAALLAACGVTVPAGDPLPTETNPACADEILSVYYDGKTTALQAAFAGWNYRRMEPAYAWAAQLLAGYTPDEVRAFAAAAIAQNLAAAEGATQTVGTRSVNGYLRVYDQIRDLIGALQTNGFAVWIVTASPQHVVEAFAPMVGVDAARVIGIPSLLDGAGKLTAHFAGCGPVADGEDTMITYIEGKRCWINKVVYGDATPAAILPRPVDDRQVFGAGDSDTDVDFLRDATALKLVLNRNKKELMCNAYNDAGLSWLINPMFISPKPMQTALYPCSTTACKDAMGVGGPCVDELGNAIPDQTDTVY